MALLAMTLGCGAHLTGHNFTVALPRLGAANPLSDLFITFAHLRVLTYANEYFTFTILSRQRRHTYFSLLNHRRRSFVKIQMSKVDHASVAKCPAFEKQNTRNFRIMCFYRRIIDMRILLRIHESTCRGRIQYSKLIRKQSGPRTSLFHITHECTFNVM